MLTHRSIGRLALVGITFLTSLGLKATADELDPRLIGFDIGPMIRFQNAREAESRREKLIRYIWPDGLPVARPAVAAVPNDCPELGALDGSLIDRVQKYDIDVAGSDFHAMTFVAHPKLVTRGPARLAIVFAGHMPEGAEHYLASGLSDAVNALLRRGFVVAAMQMPMVGWNRDTDGVLPGTKPFDISTRGTTGHNELFRELEPELQGEVFRFFLEPAVLTVNELFAQYPDRAGLLMTGLSGGGWTTHLFAAVDPRVDLSIPVAGSLPLYARPFSPGSGGDSEQWHAPLYGEKDADGDGVLDTAEGICTWLEIYALAGLSPAADRPRKQIQVLNLYDSCCFGGPVYKTYAGQLSARVQTIGSGRWSLYSDDSHRGHLISPRVIDQVIAAAISESPLFSPKSQQ